MPALPGALIYFPYMGAGVYLYKVKSDFNEFVLKAPSIGKVMAGGANSIQGVFSASIAKETRTFAPIDDVIAVTKDGYLNYNVVVTNSDTSGIEIIMIVCEGTFTDIDGNVYQTVKIGNQVWTVENLRTTKLNNGTVIPHVIDASAWGTSIPEYCYWGNLASTEHIKKYGALYNGYAVNTEKLAPAGWHVSTDAEWDTLQNYLIANGYNYDETTTGNKIAKSMAAKTDWRVDSDTGTIGYDLTKNNSSGFSAMPGGYRYYDGSYVDPIGLGGYFWSIPSVRILDKMDVGLSSDGFSLNCGLSVRLVKD